MSASAVEVVRRYHHGTKHGFNRFARSLGYLDWASQPRPFRSYIGSPHVALAQTVRGPADRAASYDDLFMPGRTPVVPLSLPAIADLLRHALGLTAWKVLGPSRWALRANPSSGNLHPTEAYVIAGPMAGLSADSGVWHYAPDRHSLEQRCAFPGDVWPFASREGGQGILIALTSIHWRESWRYGERGFRYCQHDLGHAIGGLALAAAANGWTLDVRSECAHDWIARLIGVDRDPDFVDAEREDAGCLMLLTPGAAPPNFAAAGGLAEIAHRGRWFGRASQLSDDHVQWTFIDEVAEATRDPGLADGAAAARRRWDALDDPARYAPAAGRTSPLDARALMRQRRSAVALDGLSSIDRRSFIRMLSRLLARRCVPWNAVWWTPRIHLAIFVHRVDGVPPGLYALVRDHSVQPRLQLAFDPGFAWEPIEEGLPFYRLTGGAFQSRAQRLSCDQAIAADGFFSLAMIADFEASLAEHGPSFYRHLFWESGMVGQVLYLEAEAAGARGTGIGCFYDDAVHETLGLHGAAFQSLYHFTVGNPVEDRRLTTEPGYEWE